ncbi:MAG: carbamoyltransferase, partial [Alphaproteobacteria bacterium]|nr:carbamoyltransferase [Alphaproteobacteria bacterium]
AYLGFTVNDGEYKVMGLAPHGRLRYVDHLMRMIQVLPEGQYHLALEFFDFIRGETMFSPSLCELLGNPARKPGEALSEFHCDVARSLQYVFEEIVVAKVNYLATRLDSENLCLAGGAALNCVANGEILRRSPFRNLFVQPAAGDDGACLGAAILGYLKKAGGDASPVGLKDVFLGPVWSDELIEGLLKRTGFVWQDFRGKNDALLDEVSGRLVEKQVVGWFQGAMEFGPRALGNRSILANPMDPGIRDRLNMMVKKRESFRPFAPSILEKEASSFLDLSSPSPYMLLTCQVKSTLDLPGITHVDGSARPQTVTRESNGVYCALIERFFQKTGCPLLLNTSMNVKDQPIVMSPVDALYCLVEAGLDCLVLGSFLIDKAGVPPGLEQLLPLAYRSQTVSAEDSRVQSHNIYSFSLG